jgi:hypothetical protein
MLGRIVGNGNGRACDPEFVDAIQIHLKQTMLLVPPPIKAG